MNDWLNIIITLSIVGSSISILVYSITAISRETLTAKWHYTNRKLALFFFLLPLFLITEVVLLFNTGNQSIQLEPLSFVPSTTVLLTETFVQVIFVVWLIGAVLTGARFWFVHQKLFRELRRNCITVPKEHTVWAILAQQENDMNIKRKVNLAYCQTNISPILVGVFKPTIVLPMHMIQNDELAMILKHELTHDKRKDLWVKRAGIIAIILHWYNPLIYILQKELNKWCELSCDEDVVMKMSYAERKKYGETILNMMQHAKQQQNSPFLASFLTTGQIKLKKRLIRILEVENASKPIVILSIVILLFFGSLGIISSVFAHKSISSIPIKESEGVIFRIC